jgi:hypothetical protein
MQIKGAQIYNIWHSSNTILPNLHFVYPLAKQNQSMKHKSAVVGETIAFSICNKFLNA